MPYQPRIPADDAYLQALGRAFYNFTYLEWVVIWTVVKLTPPNWGFTLVEGQTAGSLARIFSAAIRNANPPISANLSSKLNEFLTRFRGTITERNKLLHAHPYTAAGGAQQLAAPTTQWTAERAYQAAALFEEAAIFGNEIFHGDLARERP